MIRPALVLVALLALCLPACAKVGTLEQPAPLFGAKAKADYEAKKAAAAAEREKNKEAGDPEALPTDQPAPGQDPIPPRVAPAEGERPSPFGSAPPGVLPDPFNHPQ